MYNLYKVHMTERVMEKWNGFEVKGCKWLRGAIENYSPINT